MPLEEKAKMLMKETILDTDSTDVSSDEQVETTTDVVVEPKREIEVSHEQEESINTEPDSKEDSTESILEEDDTKEISQSSPVKEHDNQPGSGCVELQLALNECIDAQRDLETKVVQTLKENANFQIQVRQNMQKELEEAKKKLSGDIFIPILKQIAELYIEWRDVLDEMEDGVTKRKVAGVFESLQEILEEYGCDFGCSTVDSKRKPKYSKLKEKVFTADKSKHETVAKSHNPWIVKEPFVLYPEYVDVYVFNSELIDEHKDLGNEENNNSTSNF